jgi:nucleoside-diphosphate-sugar epimerase
MAFAISIGFSGTKMQRSSVANSRASSLRTRRLHAFAGFPLVGARASEFSGAHPLGRRQALRSMGQRHGIQGLQCRSAAIIVNPPSGGHASIGLYLARQLLSLDLEVYLLVAGQEDKYRSKQPNSALLGLREAEPHAASFHISFGDADDPSILMNMVQTRRPSAGPIAAFIDNRSQTLDEALLLHKFAMGLNAERYLYVSSCGIYEPGDYAPFIETDQVRQSAGQAQVESRFLRDSVIPFAAFRPMYIIGKHAAKLDYTNFFLDRITRKRPIPLPGKGNAFVSLTHAEDVASMLACAVLARPDEVSGQVFNAVSPRYVTLKGLAEMCHRVVHGDKSKPEIIYYDPVKLGIDPKEATGLPFRVSYPFIADPGKAMRLLAWQPRHDRTLQNDLQEMYEEYLELGLHERRVDLTNDDRIARSVGAAGKAAAAK